MATKSKIQSFYDETFLPALMKHRPAKTEVTVGVLRFSECKGNDGLNQKFETRGAIKFTITKEDESIKSFYITINLTGYFALISEEDVDRCNRTPAWNCELSKKLSLKEQNQLFIDRDVKLLAVNDIDKIMEVAFS